MRGQEYAARRFKKKSVKRILEKQYSKAIEAMKDKEMTQNNAGGSGSANMEGTVHQRCYGVRIRTFYEGKPHFSMPEMKVVVGLKRWIVKDGAGVEICKCAEDDNKTEDKKLLRFMLAAPAKGRGYAGNLPWCNRCKAHHSRSVSSVGVVQITCLSPGRGLSN
ncbi:hypothetical protein Tco_1164186 [Tanacetum coccineum]